MNSPGRVVSGSSISRILSHLGTGEPRKCKLEDRAESERPQQVHQGLAWPCLSWGGAAPLQNRLWLFLSFIVPTALCLRGWQELALSPIHTPPGTSDCRFKGGKVQLCLGRENGSSGWNGA